MKKKYSSFEEIKQDVENGIRVCWMNDRYFVSKLNDLYIIAIVSNPYYSGGNIELGNAEDFYSYIRNF